MGGNDFTFPVVFPDDTVRILKLKSKRGSGLSSQFIDRTIIPSDVYIYAIPDFSFTGLSYTLALRNYLNFLSGLPWVHGTLSGQVNADDEVYPIGKADLKASYCSHPTIIVGSPHSYVL